MTGSKVDRLNGDKCSIGRTERLAYNEVKLSVLFLGIENNLMAHNQKSIKGFKAK